MVGTLCDASPLFSRLDSATSSQVVISLKSAWNRFHCSEARVHLLETHKVNSIQFTTATCHQQINLSESSNLTYKSIAKMDPNSITNSIHIYDRSIHRSLSELPLSTNWLDHRDISFKLPITLNSITNCTGTELKIHYLSSL